MLLCSFLLDPRVRVALLSVFFFPGLAPAQTEYKLLPSNASDNAQAGWSVALSGDVAIVGAPGDSEAVFGGGSAYVYRFDGTAWTQEQKLTTDAEILERFGYSVAVSGNIAVVGMPYDSDGGAASGSVFVYRFDGTSWVEEQKLTASDGGAGDLLGWSVATTGDFVVATAGVNDDSDSEDGAAYVFRYDGAGWVEEQKLEPGELDSDDGDFFGWSVAASGDAVIVGAPGEKVDGFGSGSAYVYRYGGGAWAEEQRIDAGYIGAQFGWAVSISGDVAVVGARFDIDPTDPSAFLGSAYVFRRDGGVWVEEDQFTVPAGEGNVGLSVAVSSDLAVTAGGRDNVFAYRYENGAWSSAQELTASDQEPGDDKGLGYSVAASGDRVAAGAPGDEIEDLTTGSAYVFGLEPLVSNHPAAPDTPALPAVEVYPNPYRGRATVRFATREPGPASIRVYDLLGREVGDLYEGEAGPAGREVPFALDGLRAGVYFVRLETAGGVVTQRMTVAR